MTFILVLIVAILLLALFVFMELTELAGATLVLILLSSGGMVWIHPAIAWLIFGTVGLAAVVVVGLLVYRFSVSRLPPRDPGSKEFR